MPGQTVTREYHVIQRRGKDEKYLSGHRVITKDKSGRGAANSPNWCTVKHQAQKFDKVEDAVHFVNTIIGPSAFNYLRLVTVKERS
jgi:hypothetical protein